MHYKNLSQSEKEKKVNDILKSNPKLTPLSKELEEKGNSSDQLLYLLSLEKKYREIDPMYWGLADSYEQKYNKLRYSKTMIMGLILDQIKAYNKINELEPSLKKIAENCIEKGYSNRNIERYGHIFALNQIDEYKKRILEFQNDSNPFFLESFNNFIDQGLIPFDAYLDTIFMYKIQNLPEKFKSIAHEYLLSMNPHDSMINAKALRLIDDILNKDTKSEVFIDNLRSNFYGIKLEKIHKILVDDIQFEEFRKNISKDLSDGMMPEKALSHALEKIIAIDIMIAKNEIDELPTDLKEYAYSLTNNLNEGNNEGSFSLEGGIIYIDALKETNAKNIVENLPEEYKSIVDLCLTSEIKMNYKTILKQVTAKQAIDKLPDDLKKHANGAIDDFQTTCPRKPGEAYTYALYETEKFDEYRNLDPKYKEYADSLIKDPTNYYSYKGVIDRVNDKKIIDNLSPKLKQFVNKHLKNGNGMSGSKLSERAIQQQDAMDKITQLDEPYLSYAKDHLNYYLNHPESAYEPSEALAYGNYEKKVQDRIDKEEELYINYASEYLKYYPDSRPSRIFEEIGIYKRVLESNQYSDAYKQHFIEEVKTLISADSAFTSTRSYMKQQELE